MNLNVFALWDPNRPHPLSRVWVKSWRARKWRPRIIVPSELKGRTFRQAINARGGGVSSNFSEINYSRRPKDSTSRKIAYGLPGWRDADVVTFPGETAEVQVLQCERPLNAHRKSHKRTR